MDLSVVFLTLKLAGATTLILFLVGVPLSLWLSQNSGKASTITSVLVNLPLVLPPSVLGYYLLVSFSPAHSLGQLFEQLTGTRLVFSFYGMLVASVIFGLPFMIQPIKSALEQLPQSLADASYSLGKTRFQTARFVLLPNIRSSLLAAIALTFTHALGEFGVVLMIGGNIPGETRVASIAIYDEVQALNYSVANHYSALLLAASFVALLFANTLNRKKNR